MPPDKLLDRAMYQVVRDTPDSARSALRGHSLLRDLVGDDGVIGTVTDYDVTLVGGEFLQIQYAPSSTSLSVRVLATTTAVR